MRNSFDYTKGEWRASPNKDHTDCHYVEAEGAPAAIAAVSDLAGQGLDNLYLITAAPSIYEALLALLSDEGGIRGLSSDDPRAMAAHRAVFMADRIVFKVEND